MDIVPHPNGFDWPILAQHPALSALEGELQATSITDDSAADVWVYFCHQRLQPLRGTVLSSTEAFHVAKEHLGKIVMEGGL